MTLDILMQSSKYRRLAYDFQNNFDVTEKLTKAINYNNFLQDIPINDLLEATDLNQMATTVKNIFKELKRVKTDNTLSQ